MNIQLQRLYEEDQADRTQSMPLDRMLERDRERRREVGALVKAGALQTPEDYFHAAVIYQHGEELDDFWQAHLLAKQAADLGHPQARHARWLAAAAYDRWLTYQGKPQKYGTQFRNDGSGWRLMECDPDTTDEERAEWGVPPIAVSLARVEALNRRGKP